MEKRGKWRQGIGSVNKYYVSSKSIVLATRQHSIIFNFCIVVKVT